MSMGTRAPRPGEGLDRTGEIGGGRAPQAGGTTRAGLPIIDDETFRQLVRERTSFAWTLSIIMLVVYLTFILLVAFAHDAMATRVGGSELSVGILLGLFVIVFAFALTGVYTARANSRFDQLIETLTRGRRP